jgi:hypothetical protein
MCLTSHHFLHVLTERELLKLNSSLVISPKVLSVANLSCYDCGECLFDDNTKCTNSEYCGERRVLQMEYMNRKELDSNDYMYENESVSDLVTIGSVVAVLAKLLEMKYEEFYDCLEQVYINSIV